MVAAMRAQFTRWATDRLDRDPTAALVLADIGAGLFARSGAFDRHPGRVVNAGIREALAIGVAAGFGLEGYRPIVHSYAPFLVERGFEQIKLDLVHQEVPAVLVGFGGTVDATAEGRSHQGPGVVSVLSTLPSVRIELPSHVDEVDGALDRAMRHDGLAYVGLSELQNAEPAAAGLTEWRRGASGTVLALGPIRDAVMEAAAGLDLTVLHTSTVAPLDGAELRARADPEQPLVVVEPLLEGTSLPAVVAALGPSRRPLLSVGIPRAELRRYGRPQEHLEAHGLSARALRGRLQSFLRSCRP